MRNQPTNQIEANLLRELRTIASELRTFADSTLSAIGSGDDLVLEGILDQRNAKLLRVQQIAHSHPHLVKASSELLEAATKEDEVLQVAIHRGDAIKEELDSTQQVMQIRSAYGDD